MCSNFNYIYIFINNNTTDDDDNYVGDNDDSNDDYDNNDDDNDDNNWFNSQHWKKTSVGSKTSSYCHPVNSDGENDSFETVLQIKT